MKQKLIEFYLDYVNNYLSTEKMANDYNMELDHVRKLIKLGEYYNNINK